MLKKYFILICIVAGIVAIFVVSTTYDVNTKSPQNDLYCSTIWEIHYSGNIQNLNIILDKEFKIALNNFGDDLVISERNIRVKSINQTIANVSIQGIFDLDSVQHEILSSILNDTDGVSDIISSSLICT